MNGQPKRIQTGVNSYIDIIFLTPSSLVDYSLSNKKLTPLRLNKNGVSRTYKLDNGKIIIEFYNKTAIVINSTEDLKSLEMIDFLKLTSSKKSNEVSYLVNIEKSVYEKLLKNAEKYYPPKEFLSFAEYFKLNSGNLLVKWKLDYSNGKFAILENIRTMLGLDSEIEYFLNEEDNTTNKKYQIISLTRENIIPTFQYEYEDQIDLDRIRKYLSKILNIDLEQLDLSRKSLDKIESAIFWNQDHLNYRDLVLPCTYYLGEILKKEYDLDWIFFPKKKYGVLKTREGEFVDIAKKLDGSLIDNDDGIGEIIWVIEEIDNQLILNQK